MNIFRHAELSIDFNDKLQRVSLQSDIGWVSLTLSSFRLLISLLKFGSKYEKVSIDQICSSVSFTGINGEYIVEFKSKSHIGLIIIGKHIVGRLINQSEIVFSRIGTLKMKSETLDENILNRTQSLPSVANDKKSLKRKSIVPTLIPVKKSRTNPTNILHKFKEKEANDPSGEDIEKIQVDI